MDTIRTCHATQETESLNVVISREIIDMCNYASSWIPKISVDNMNYYQQTGIFTGFLCVGTGVNV